MKSKNVDQLTFKVFIEYLVETPMRSFDIHWVPIYLTCKPCLVNYTFIGKTETMAKDSKAILERIGVNRSLTVANAQADGHSGAKLHQFFSDLDKELLEKLYKVYEMDFVLFGFSPNIF